MEAAAWGVVLPTGPGQAEADREYEAFAVAGSPAQRAQIARIGGFQTWYLGGCLAVIMLSAPRSHLPRWSAGVLAVAAFGLGVLLLRLAGRIPMRVLDFMAVATAPLFVVLGLTDAGIAEALPAIYVVFGTSVCAMRRWQVAVAHGAVMAASYAVFLAREGDVSAPATRWLAVMAAVATSGGFIRWLVGNVAQLAVAEHDDRARVEQATRELEQVNQAKRDFLAQMSHELRTPLNAVLGFADLLHQQVVGPLTRRQLGYVEDIAGSGRHLVALVDDVLDLAKVETGTVELEVSPLDLCRAFDEARTMVRERATRANVAVELHVESDVGYVEADARKVRQVLVNLLSNAVKFTPPGGRVVVQAWRSGDRVVTAVQDTGIGIAPEDQERVFREFEQSVTVPEGTGLGLPLARRLVELHGGRLWLTSESGAGSTFYFDLPRHQDDVTGHVALAAHASETGLEPDYSAFVEPGSPASTALVARVGSVFALVAAGLGIAFAAITPATLMDRLLVLAVAGVGLVGAFAMRRLGGGLPRPGVESMGAAGIAAITVLSYFGGQFSDLIPLTYCWVTMTTFHLWPYRRAVGHVLAIAACYGVVLALRHPPGAFTRWLALLTLLWVSGFVVSWFVKRLRALVVAEQEARRTAQRLQVQLAAASQHKSDFLANMSHELRTPLNAVIGFSELLLSGATGPLTEVQRSYVEEVLRAGRHLLALINDILDLAKLQAGQVRLDTDVVGVDALFERAAAEVAPEAARRRIAVETSVDPDADIVTGDHYRLEQLLANLVTNAVKFTPDGGSVRLAATRSGGELLLSVQDTGIGVHVAERQRIFEAFHQAGSTSSRRPRQGTGLGLALVKGIAELHGGRVLVDSRPGRGSTFTVALPVAARTRARSEERVRVRGSL